MFRGQRQRVCAPCTDLNDFVALQAQDLHTTMKGEDSVLVNAAAGWFCLRACVDGSVCEHVCVCVCVCLCVCVCVFLH